MYRHLAARGLLDLSSQASEVKLDQQGLSIENSVKPDPLADLIEPVWSGTFVYRYLISIAKLEERWPEHRVSKGPVMVSQELSLVYFHCNLNSGRRFNIRSYMRSNFLSLIILFLFFSPSRFYLCIF